MKNIRCYFFITIWLWTAFFMVSATNVTNNRALHKGIHVSSEMAGYPAANVVDGQDTTGWGVDAVTDPEAWIIVDLKESLHINDIELEWYTTPTSSYAAKNYRVSCSGTAANDDWQVIEDVDNNTATLNRISLNDSARYIKVECLEPGTGINYYGLAELRVLQYAASIVGTKGFSTGQADYVTLAADSTGALYVAYKDGAYVNQRYKVYVKMFVDGTWRQIGEFEEYEVYGLDFVIHNDILYLTYQYYNTIKPAGDKWKCMTVKKYVDNNWVSCDGNILDFKTEKQTALRVNPVTGVLTLAYITDALDGLAEWNKPRLLTYNETSKVWTEDRIPMLDDSWVNSIALEFSSTGTTYVGMGLARQGSYKSRATVMEKAAGTWTTAGFPMFSGNRINYPSMVCDDADVLYFAHRDFGATDKASVWYLYDNPTASEPVKRYFKPFNKLGISKRAVDYTHLICDNDTLYVGYCDQANKGRVTVHTFNADSGTWDLIGYPGGFSDGQVEWVSIAKVGNTIYTAYTDWSVSGRITVSAYTMQ